MNLILKAEWYPDGMPEPDASWLAVYVNDCLRESIPAVRVCFPLLPADPIAAFEGQLIIHLYDKSDPMGGAGRYVPLNGSYGFYNPAPQCQINVAWYWQYMRGHRIVQFEARQFWAHMISGFGAFGHPLGWLLPNDLGVDL